MKIILTGSGFYFSGKVSELLGFLRGNSANVTVRSFVLARLQ